ncbi:DUF1289 domain-containing protein [Paracoccus beibuensis]|uniref:DUF1289 domain-containing protein n=1 Tax=Paracoccus beibuensis TaxID=547602 RepID=UPI00223F9B47|nr:DUF1289 domain-containing protein [Paracoccus beibuensis]
MTEAIASPCVGICTLDDDLRICTGCYRSLDEIASWGSLPPEARRRVIRDLPRRRRTSGRGDYIPCRGS